MKLMRKSKEGLQVLRLQLTAPGKAGFTLFPMIHVADRKFFKHVRAHADSHDAVFMEGVRSLLGRTAGRAHRIAAAGSKKLAAQGAAFRAHDTRESSNRFNSDIDPDAFRKHWSKVPLLRRILFYIALLLMGVALRFKHMRAMMADSFAEMDDLSAETSDEVFGKGFHKALITERDAALLENCEQVMAGWAGKQIAIVWGAGHMPQLIRSLTEKHGYEIAGQDWITAITA